MNKTLADHGHYTSRKLMPTDKRIDFDQFRITHYAGEVGSLSLLFYPCW
jgi:hypothetical protein